VPQSGWEWPIGLADGALPSWWEVFMKPVVRPNPRAVAGGRKFSPIVLWQVIVLLIVALSASFGPGIRAAEPGDPREVMLETMREKADAIQVRRIGENEAERLPLIPEPFFRYSDDPRAIVDASLWGIGGKGRPAAMAKIEYYERPGGKVGWFYCLVSLSDGLLNADFESNLQWQSTQPGLKAATFEESPAPAWGEVARLVQMKNLARRFTARVFGASLSAPTTQEQMRLLARPLYRYADEESGLYDGAIFGFGTNGTNPDLLLLVELRGPTIAEAKWQCGFARMTTESLRVHLDEREVWTAKRVYASSPNTPALFDTWLFFFER